MNKIISAGSHRTTYNVNFHTHDYWELVYCTSGEGYFTTRQGVSINYEKHDIICIPPRIEHCNNSKSGFTNIHLIMDNISLPDTGFSKIIDNTSHVLLGAFNQAHYFYNCDIPKRYDILTPIGELIASCLIFFLGSVPFSHSVEKLRAEIIRGFSDCDFDLKQTLSTKSKNPEYLRKMFKKETGVTPLQFLTDTRINYAKRLLKAKLNLHNINISEIAMECGYNDPLYFSRIFKKHTGLSPNIYSKNKS